MEPHNSFNHFLSIIDLISDERDALPKTVTSKNGIRIDDPKLRELFNWIRSVMPEPPKDIAGAESERELVGNLLDLKKKTIRHKAKSLVQEFEVFKGTGSPVVADLYVFDGNDTVIYEAKKDVADVKNLYQLLMYWDGAVADGHAPTEGILLSAAFAKGVPGIIKMLNGRKDANGNNYNFSAKTWRDEGIPYPAP